MKYELLTAVIMAGGTGKRFWPKSRINIPKQFANIISDRSMIEETVIRLDKVVSQDRINVVTGAQYVSLVQKLLPDFTDDQIITEPMGRDTAACILLSVMHIDDDDALFYILPSDQYITNLEQYHQDIENAAEAALQDDVIVTIGITPTRPDTGYGYIHLDSSSGGNTCKVLSFKEKPDPVTAQDYLNDGNYVWNAGMFFFKKKTIIKAFQTYAPGLYDIMNHYFNTSNQQERKNIFQSIEKISFDYAIMEKHNKVQCVKAGFVWDDVGSWNAVSRIHDPDNDQNYFKGNIYSHESSNTNCISDDQDLIVLNNIDNLNIIKNNSILYITNRDKESEIKTILSAFEKNEEYKKYL